MAENATIPEVENAPVSEGSAGTLTTRDFEILITALKCPKAGGDIYMVDNARLAAKANYANANAAAAAWARVKDKVWAQVDTAKKPPATTKKRAPKETASNAPKPEAKQDVVPVKNLELERTIQAMGADDAKKALQLKQVEEAHEAIDVLDGEELDDGDDADYGTEVDYPTKPLDYGSE